MGEHSFEQREGQGEGNEQREGQATGQTGKRPLLSARGGWGAGFGVVPSGPPRSDRSKSLRRQRKKIIVSPLDFVRHMKTERTIGNLLKNKGGISAKRRRYDPQSRQDHASGSDWRSSWQASARDRPIESRSNPSNQDRAHRIKIEARSEHPIQIESRSGPIESRAGPVKIESRSDPSNPDIPDRAHRLKSGPIESRSNQEFRSGPSNQDRIKSGPIDTRSNPDRTHRIQSGAASFG